MRIAWIGGLGRNEAELVRIAAVRGHRLEVHSGATQGRGCDEIRNLVERAELVIILTDVNSHNGVGTARRAARQLGRGTLLVRRCGLARFAHLLDALERRAA